MKTFIKWPGNKRRYLKILSANVPSSYNTYVEPFLGSGALFLYLHPQKWIINDMNKDLINLWKNVKNHPNTIIAAFKNFKNKFINLTKEQKISLCRHLTSKIPLMQYNIERSITFLLMKYCAYMGNIMTKDKFYFHGLELNIYKNRFPSEEYHNNLQKISHFLQHGRIHNTDYKQILEQTMENDFVFLDPPYIESHDYKFTYNPNEQLVTLKDLLDQVKKLDQKRVKWLMTQADTKEVRQVFHDYKIIKFHVFRAYTNTKKYELMIRNY